MNDQSADGRATRIRAPLGTGARTPEELEVLLEDSLLMRDVQALTELFDAGAMFVAGGEQSARGAEAIAQWALALWAGPHSYVAEPRRVMQARDIALIVAERSINVACRDRQGTWRYAIVHQLDQDENERRTE
jgi:hypothetical protein